MQATREFWAIATGGVFLVLLSVVYARPVLLLGAAIVGGYLVTHQYAFLRAATRVDQTSTIDHSLAPSRAQTDDPVRVTLTASLDEPTPLPVRITGSLPVIARPVPTTDRTIHLAPGDRSGSTTYHVQCHVAGTTTIDPPTITLTSRLFSETFTRGPTRDLTVTPPAPRSIHVGAGGEDVSVFGEHTTGRLGIGLIPDTIREYVPGDAADRIDWNTTARLNHPYVREYEMETDRVTMLLVDHRASMTTGRPGETKLDYARNIALAFVQSAREHPRPLGLLTVGTDGITTHHAPGATATHISRLESAIAHLQPTPPAQPDDQSDRISPATARRYAARLADDSSAFATTLRPFFDALDPYVHAIERDPVFTAIRLLTAQRPGNRWTVIITDDSHRAELRETVALAATESTTVLVFLTPTVLYEPGGLADLDAAYDDYLAFEEYRRELARHEHVTAFELAPGDRLDALLAHHRDTRTPREVRQ